MIPVLVLSFIFKTNWHKSCSIIREDSASNPWNLNWIFSLPAAADRQSSRHFISTSLFTAAFTSTDWLYLISCCCGSVLMSTWQTLAPLTVLLSVLCVCLLVRRGSSSSVRRSWIREELWGKPWGGLQPGVRLEEWEEEEVAFTLCCYGKNRIRFIYQVVKLIHCDPGSATSTK